MAPQGKRALNKYKPLLFLDKGRFLFFKAKYIMEWYTKNIDSNKIYGKLQGWYISAL